MIKYILFAFTTFTTLTAYADKTHHAGGSPYEPATMVVSSVTPKNGIALSIATSQHHFDFGTHSWQGSIGVGSFDNEHAISFGAAKRLNRVLINVSVGLENGKLGYGAGINRRF